MKLHLRLACVPKHQKCKFVPRRLSMIVVLTKDELKIIDFLRFYNCVESIFFLFATSKLEDTKQEGQEQEKKEENPQQQIPDEENGIEMSENFEGALHDVETGGEEENEKSEEENEDESEVDKQMGEVDGQDTEKLDEKMWGDSDDEDEKEVDLRNINLTN